MWLKSNYDWTLFLSIPMAFNEDQTHDSVLTKSNNLNSRHKFTRNKIKITGALLFQMSFFSMSFLINVQPNIKGISSA